MNRLILCVAMLSVIIHGHAGYTETYPTWQPGELEYHMICTGRGEANFLIMPDGTSMLIDAGDWYDHIDEMAPAMPDELFRAGEWIKRYILRVNPSGENVDYLMVSHFHNDHTGDTTVKRLPKTKDKKENYVLTGITEVGQSIKFGKEFDRGYPGYNYPTPIDDPDVDNLRLFLKDKNIAQERFEVGRLNQIAMTRERAKYDTLFSIRNLSSSGEFWTGKENETVKGYDLNIDNVKGRQNENTNSIAVCINYGPFKLFTGGDLTGGMKDAAGKWFNLENTVGSVCGPVDVAKLNHHGYRGSTSEDYVRHMDAQTYLVPVWDYWHIQPSVMSNIEKGGRFNGVPIVFPTHVFYNHRREFGDKSWFKMISPDFGHVIVKVAPGGDSYRVFVVDATDESMNVKSVYGSYISGKRR